MATGSMLNAGPMREVFLLYAGYGSISGERTYPKGRLWVLAESADPDATLTVRVAHNSPKSGQVIYEDLGLVSSIQMRAGKWVQVILPNSNQVRLVDAPCVCGAGAVGYAGPVTERHFITPLHPQRHQRVQVTV